MKYYFTIIFILTLVVASAQQQTYDLITFTPPKGWTKNTHENVIGFSITDNVKRIWAQISIVKSTTSAGSIDKDFVSEWKQFAVKPYGVSEAPLEVESQVLDGWNVKSGLGRFQHNFENANLLLTSFSNGSRCMSMLILSNTTDYGPVLDAFLASVKLPRNEAVQQNSSDTVVPLASEDVATKSVTPHTSDGFKFNTTNFDDGWTSVVQEEWVEATKGNIRVLLHYPRKEEQEYISQQDQETRIFWDLLVAPRYVSKRDFFLYSYNNAFEPAHLAHGYLTDKEGKTQFVALFMKAKSGWIEIITPDKNTFVQAFGVDQPDSYFGEWDKLSNLAGLNRFAVGENDLQGKWSSDFSSSMQYYSVYTGLYAGYNAYQSNETFIFGPGNTYKWKIVAANSANGATDVQKDESSGTYSFVNNWQFSCSKIGKGPKTYNAYFRAIKGGRVLNLQMTDYGGYSAYGKVQQ